MRAGLDTTGLEPLLVVLDSAHADTPREAKRIVAKAAVNVKKDARKRASGLRHAPLYPRSIGYDEVDTALGPAADVGPDKDRPQGALGNILEYGTTNNPPRPHMGPAVAAELPRMEKAAADLAARLLESR